MGSPMAQQQDPFPADGCEAASWPKTHTMVEPSS